MKNILLISATFATPLPANAPAIGLLVGGADTGKHIPPQAEKKNTAL